MTIKTVGGKSESCTYREQGLVESLQNAAHINGPQRAQNKAIYLLVFCDVKAYVSCTEYDSTR